MSERVRKGKNWYTQCTCGNWKAEKAKRCQQCYRAEAAAKKVCPKCGNAKHPRSNQCHRCASDAKLKPEKTTCPICGGPKDYKATHCWDCYQAQTFDGPTHCSECNTQLTNPWLNTTGMCLGCYDAARALQPTYCIDCGVEITRQSKRCRACAIRWQLDPSRRYHYNGHWFRSGWEARTAYWLDTLRTPFEYERRILTARTRKGKKLAYLPDFYIPPGTCRWPVHFQHLPKDGDFFIEVKGFFREHSKRKMRLVAEQNPDVTIVLFRRKEMEHVPELPHQEEAEQLSLWPSGIISPK